MESQLDGIFAMMFGGGQSRPCMIGRGYGMQ